MCVCARIFANMRRNSHRLIRKFISSHSFTFEPCGLLMNFWQQQNRTVFEHFIRTLRTDAGARCLFAAFDHIAHALFSIRWIRHYFHALELDTIRMNHNTTLIIETSWLCIVHSTTRIEWKLAVLNACIYAFKSHTQQVINELIERLLWFRVMCEQKKKKCLYLIIIRMQICCVLNFPFPLCSHSIRAILAVLCVILAKSNLDEVTVASIISIQYVNSLRFNTQISNDCYFDSDSVYSFSIVNLRLAKDFCGGPKIVVVITIESLSSSMIRPK